MNITHRQYIVDRLRCYYKLRALRSSFINHFKAVIQSSFCFSFKRIKIRACSQVQALLQNRNTHPLILPNVFRLQYNKLDFFCQ